MKIFEINFRSGRHLLFGGLVLLNLVWNVWVFSTGWAALSLLSRAVRMQQMAANPATLKPQTVAQEIHGARQELLFLRVELAPILWLSARLGGDLSVAEPLMDAAVESTIAADESLSALALSLSDMSLTSLSLSAVPRVLDALASAKPALKRSEMHLDNAAAALARMNGPLSPQVERGFSKVQKLVELGQMGIGAAQVAPELLGRDGPRKYVVLVQNSDELRPTGGFISNFGRIEISHGTVISQTFQGSYAVDDFSHDYPDPPKPLLDYMGSEQWVFRDANWSPDFPTSARDAIRLYQISRPEDLNGVITINQKAVLMIIAGLEPLTVEGISEPVTTANAEQLFQEAWQAGLIEATHTTDLSVWYDTRKKFVGATVRAAMDKLTTGKVNWSRLGQGMLDAIRQRQIMIYSNGPEATKLRQLKWDGALRASDSDYLMIVDSNVGFAKVNPLIRESAAYHVRVAPDGTARASVIVDYSHQGKKSGIVCSPIVPYVESLTYAEMMHRCYYDYLRLIVPQGSRLRGVIPQTVPGKYLLSKKQVDSGAETLSEETARTIFGQFFIVEYGQHLQAGLEYDLPTVIRNNAGNKEYSLLLQKQSGTDALPVKVTLTLPPRARLVSAAPRPLTLEGDRLEFVMTLDTDREIKVVYALSP